MRRFICLLLVFALCVSLFTISANAAADGSFSSWKLIGLDDYNRSYSGQYRVIDDQAFQTLLLACYDINFQVITATGSAAFIPAVIRLNNNQYTDFNTIAFSYGTVYVSDELPTTPVVIGGIPVEAGSQLNITELYHSVFSRYFTYTATNNGRSWSYYLPADEDNYLMVADLSDSSITEALFQQLDGIASSLSGIQSYSSSLASYVTQINSKLATMNTNISSTLSYVTKLNTACTSINEHLTAIQAYENVSATQLLNIVDILTADMPTIINDLETALDFLYSIDNDVYHIKNHLATIHNDLTKTNEYLESIEEHLSAEALKGYDTNTGMNFFELAGNVLGNGFNVIGSFFSYAFMSISALLAPGLEGFDKIANIWSWNNSGYDPDYIVPDSGGG